MSDRLTTNVPAPGLGLSTVPVFGEHGETRSAKVPSDIPCAYSAKTRRHEPVVFNRVLGSWESACSQNPALYHVVDNVLLEPGRRRARLGAHGPDSPLAWSAISPPLHFKMTWKYFFQNSRDCQCQTQALPSFPGRATSRFKKLQVGEMDMWVLGCTLSVSCQALFDSDADMDLPARIGIRPTHGQTMQPCQGWGGECGDGQDIRSDSSASKTITICQYVHFQPPSVAGPP